MYGSEASGRGSFSPTRSNASRIHGLALNFSLVWASSSIPMSTLLTRNPLGVKRQRSRSRLPRLLGTLTAQPLAAKASKICSSGSKLLR